MPALIIFDIDGTLFQTDLVTVPAVQRTFAAHGLPQPDAHTICSFFGQPVQTYEAWLASLAPADNVKQIIDDTNTLELELIATEGRLYPGIPELLAQLRHDGHALAICSNGPDDYVNTFLDAHQMRQYFDIIRTRGTKYDGKKTMVKEIMGIISIRPAIVIGDRHDDIEAAHASGAYAIAACYGFGGEEESAGADKKVLAVKEIPDALRQIQSV